jgi:Flp pilus assembly pilin Flp
MIEYTMLISIVAAAVIAMQLYVQRAARATLKVLEEQINAEVVGPPIPPINNTTGYPPVTTGGKPPSGSTPSNPGTLGPGGGGRRPAPSDGGAYDRIVERRVKYTINLEGGE